MTGPPPPETAVGQDQTGGLSAAEITHKFRTSSVASNLACRLSKGLVGASCFEALDDGLRDTENQNHKPAILSYT